MLKTRRGKQGKTMRCIQWLLGLAVLMATACAAQAAPPESGSVVQLGFRMGHRCELHTGGAVDCVSESPYLGGWRGNDATYRPVRMVPRGATQLAVGGFANCAIVEGALDCWNALPATGKKTTTPKRIIASGVTSIAVGDDHACAAANGAALCWGSDSYGQTGHSDDQDDRYGITQSAPWQVIAHGVTQVTAGGDSSCAIADGVLWCWGNTRLADDPRTRDHLTDHAPLRVFAHDVSAVAAGSHHICAIVSGALWCWGDNSRGQVGIGYSVDHAQHSPNAPPYNASKYQVFTDGDQTCVWQDWKHVTCEVTHPVKVIAHGVSAVFASGEETCALVSGALMCWGYNWEGQLGIASDKHDVLKPTLAIASDVSFAALTRQRTCAVMKSGALSCTLPCTHDVNHCPATPRFVAGDPNDMSGIEARLGVWRGSIGGSKIMVCLGRPDTFSDSMYYYLRHRFSIPLHANDNSGATWNEASPKDRAPDGAKPVAMWALQPPVGNRMEGTWSTTDGSRKAPILLTRVADSGENLYDGCSAVDGSPARTAFNAPRVASQKLDVKESGGFRYVSALGGHISMTELPDSLPHATRFNTAMRTWFASQIAGYYECASTSFNGIPDYNETYEIDLLAPPWLVAQKNWSGYCGGAHPDSETDYTTWNLTTGKTVSPWDFLKDSRWDYTNKVDRCGKGGNCVRRPSPKLSAIIAARFNRDNADNGDCAGAIDDNLNFLQLHPEKNGLVFSTTFPHVIQACDEDIALPWKTLMPFLTVQGKAAMRSLQGSR